MQNKTTKTSCNINKRAEPIEIIELLFFAYRDFIADPDKILKDYDFGRAHHRLLYFIWRNPGIITADLLAILGITKQSLARVLKDLINTKLVEQRTGKKDRRNRLLYLTPGGQKLIERLTRPQINRITNALANLSTEEQTICRDFLYNLLNR